MPKHLKIRGFCLIWNTRVEIRLIFVAPRYFHNLPCKEKRYAAHLCSPSFHHLFDRFLHTFLASLFVPKHQQFEPETILCAVFVDP